MAIVFKENFESDGYYNTGWTEYGLGTIDPDFSTTTVSGAPRNWGNRCILTALESDEPSLTRYDFGADFDTIYVHWEFIISKAHPLPVGGAMNMLRLDVNGSSTHCIYTFAYGASNSTYTFYYGGDSLGVIGTSVLNYNDMVYLDVLWDPDNTNYELYVNGSLEGSGDPNTGNKIGEIEFGAHTVGGDPAPSDCDVYWDNIFMDDTTWPDAGWIRRFNGVFGFNEINGISSFNKINGIS
jgi:hypothetical protein